MKFGHYTVFDTPEENKHTQVYVEYDVPNNDNLEGATGTIILTEGGQGSGGGGDAGNGIRSITISPAITTTPALESYFPIYWEDLTDEQKQDGVLVYGTVESGVIKSGDTYQFIITPTADWYVYDIDAQTLGEKGAPYTITVTADADDNLGLMIGCTSDNVVGESTKLLPVMVNVELE